MLERATENIPAAVFDATDTVPKLFEAVTFRRVIVAPAVLTPLASNQNDIRPLVGVVAPLNIFVKSHAK
jgi:hypothetical protein